MDEVTNVVSSRKRLIAYVASATSCVMSASFTVFSLYTDALENDLGYTPLQINYVSMVAELGLYLCVPFLGLIADSYRLSSIGVISCVTYVVGYGGCSWVMYTKQPWQMMAVCFGVVGIACSASFISSLVNTARLFPNSALLAIAIPTTLYGLSSLLYAQIINAYLDASTSTMLGRIFISLAVCLFFIGILATFAPIWGSVDICAPPSDAQVREEGSEIPKSHLHRFFSDYRTLGFLLAFVFVSGPLEMYQNNLGLVAKIITGSTATVSHQVSLFTGFSTVTRLAVGAIADTFRVQPPILLASLLLVLSAVDLAFAHGRLSLSFVSGISGIGYGSSFTLFPMIVSHVWGIEGFATYWGLFILGPAVGSFIFSLLFALEVQGLQSYKETFTICSLVVLMSCFLIIWLKLHMHYEK